MTPVLSGLFGGLLAYLVVSGILGGRPMTLAARLRFLVRFVLMMALAAIVLMVATAAAGRLPSVEVDLARDGKPPLEWVLAVGQRLEDLRGLQVGLATALATALLPCWRLLGELRHFVERHEQDLDTREAIEERRANAAAGSKG